MRCGAAKPQPGEAGKSQAGTGAPEGKKTLESGKQEALGKGGEPSRHGEPGALDTRGRVKPGVSDADEEEADASNKDTPLQPYEVLSIRVAQKYFFDRDFGGALVDGQRKQFYPINTLSGFSYGGHSRSFSPANLSIRYRPLSKIYGDVRMDIGSGNEAIRNVIVSAGLDTDRVSVRTRWYLSRRIDIANGTAFEAGTFPGNQLVTTLQFGNELKGLYGGTRIDYDFTDRLISDTQFSNGRLRHSRSFVGYGWDCCGVQFNYNTFKAGLRNESAFSFTFTLAGIGSFGSDQFSQLGGGRGGRKRGKKLAKDPYEDY